MAQLVASVSGVVLGVAEVVGSTLASGKIFTASIGSVDPLYPSVFIHCLNLHQFLILCSSKAMMFVKLYFRTSDAINIYIYKISLSPKTPNWLANNRAKARPSIWRTLSQCPICCSWVSSKLKKGPPPTTPSLQR